MQHPPHQGQHQQDAPAKAPELEPHLLAVISALLRQCRIETRGSRGETLFGDIVGHTVKQCRGRTRPSLFADGKRHALEHHQLCVALLEFDDRCIRFGKLVDDVVQCQFQLPQPRFILLTPVCGPVMDAGFRGQGQGRVVKIDALQRGIQGNLLALFLSVGFIGQVTQMQGHIKKQPRQNEVDGDATPIVMERSLHAHLPLPARRGLSDDILTEIGAPGGIRTPDQWLRKPLLYPAELRARMAYFNRYPRLTAAAVHARARPAGSGCAARRSAPRPGRGCCRSRDRSGAGSSDRCRHRGCRAGRR